MKKRLIAVLLLTVLLFSVVSCADESKDTGSEELSMLSLFSSMLSINKVESTDKVIGFFGNCPLYLSFVLNEGETLSDDGMNIMNENGDTLISLSDRTLVLAYAMAAYLLNYINNVEMEGKTLQTYEEYQTEFLRFAGFPDSSDEDKVNEFISEEAAYTYLESFIESGVKQLIDGDETLRDKATDFIYGELIKDGTLKEDRTFTAEGLLSYKQSVLVSSKYNFLQQNEYVTKIDRMLEDYYVYGGIK